MEWHVVLGEGLAVPWRQWESDEEWSERSDAVHDDWFERTHVWTGKARELWPPDLRAELEASREWIFKPDHHHRVSHVQATVATLRADDVVRAVRVR